MRILWIHTMDSAPRNSIEARLDLGNLASSRFPLGDAADWHSACCHGVGPVRSVGEMLSGVPQP